MLFQPEGEMEFDLVTLEVDGTLDNPYVVATVSLWAVVLALVSGRAALLWSRRYWGHSSSGEGRRAPIRWTLLVAVLAVMTPVAQQVIGTALYRPGFPDVTLGVGFWGGPPNWPAWTAALLAGAIVWLTDQVRHRQERQKTVA